MKKLTVKKKAMTLGVAFFTISIMVCHSQSNQKATRPRIDFIHSPLGDYLYFLFNRKKFEAFPQMDSVIGITNVPKLKALLALPEIVASSQKRDYKVIYHLLEKYYKNTRATLIEKPFAKRLSYSDKYPAYDTILSLVKKGEAHYPSFARFWKQHVEPKEIEQITEWKKQLRENKVMETYYQITKRSFKTKRLEVAAMAYHLAGSANYSPAGIYTSLFNKPNLPWVIGHEGTHLLLSGPAGADWMKSPKAQDLAILAKAKGETLYEIEENTCHFLQAMLAKACGTEESTYSIHAPYPKGFRREMLARMEAQWEQYRKSKEDIIDYMMRVAEETLLSMADKAPGTNDK
jgi:hypothetical protein